jgi:NADH dehydrogenase (ubiquinone) 1 beta subcomplex subunit 11
VSFGFSNVSEEEDINWRNAMMFVTVTVALVGMSFQMAYWPDVKMRDWGQRQAYIELARREALGLPPVSPDLVPPENINLPSDEELGDFDIVV